MIERERDDIFEAYIARIADGDQAALAALYTETRSAVYGFALSILRNSSDAEDVLQDTYVKVWSAAAGYRPQGKPMAWVMTVTKNLAMSHLRRQSRNADIPEEEWRLFYTENPAVTSDDRVALESALMGLGDQEREIVMLHAVTGLKHSEIAAIMKLPLSTVLSKYSRARKKLQVMLGEGN